MLQFLPPDGVHSKFHSKIFPYPVGRISASCDWVSVSKRAKEDRELKERRRLWLSVQGGRKGVNLKVLSNLQQCCLQRPLLFNLETSIKSQEPKVANNFSKMLSGVTNQHFSTAMDRAFNILDTFLLRIKQGVWGQIKLKLFSLNEKTLRFCRISLILW